jgi:uncharacterized cupredoxin-like copper-binding protein
VAIALVALAVGVAALAFARTDMGAAWRNNAGALPHEFVIGDASTQLAHENEMSAGRMAGEPNAVEVPAGQTVRLVYTFGQPGTLEIGCHVAGHFAAGMRGTITISPS